MALFLISVSVIHKYPVLMIPAAVAFVAAVMYGFSAERKMLYFTALALLLLAFLYPFFNNFINRSLVMSKFSEDVRKSYTVTVEDSYRTSGGTLVLGKIIDRGNIICAVFLDGCVYLPKVADRVRFFGKVGALCDERARELMPGTEFFSAKSVFAYADAVDYTVLPSGSFTPLSLREKYVTYLDGVFAKHFRSPDAVSYARALLCGDKSGIPLEIGDSFSVTGLAPYLAVSGVHLATVMLFALALSSPIGIPLRVYVPMTIAFCVCFAMVTGEKNSCIRAAVMFVVGALSSFTGDEDDTYSSVGVAFIVLWLLRPDCTFDCGTQLSFIATLAVISGSRLALFLRELFPGFVYSFIITPFAISAAAVLFTAPFTLFYFGGVPTAAVVANIIIQPIFVPIMFLLILLALSNFVGFSLISRCCATVSEFLIGIFDETAKLFAADGTGYIAQTDMFENLIAPIFYTVFAVAFLYYIYCLSTEKKKAQDIAALCVCGVSFVFVTAALFTVFSQ